MGKTWLIKEFGKIAYKNIVYINFDSNSRMSELFSIDLNTDRLIMGLEIYAGHKITPMKLFHVFAWCGIAYHLNLQRKIENLYME